MARGVKGKPQDERIRFGIMCSGHTFSAWEAKCIQELIAIDGVDVALLIVDDRPPAPRPAGTERLSSLFNPKTVLWRAYQRLILNRRSRSTMKETLSAEFADVPVIRCQPVQSGKFVQRFRPEEVAAIRQHDLHFVLRFAFNILRGDILHAARYGIWSFHHGDPDKFRGAPPGFWEIYRRDPVTGTVLQRLTERLDAGVMLHQGYFKTNPASYARSRDTLFFGAAEWPAKLCRQLQAGDDTPFDQQASSSSAPIFRAPNSLQMVRFLWTSGWAWIADQLRALLVVQQWSVGIIDAPIEQVVGLVEAPDKQDLVRSATWLTEPKGRYLADPIAVQREGKLTFLTEDYDWQTELGHIASIEVGADGTTSSSRVAIRLPTHLSYPYLLEVGDKLYCIPESSASGHVELYLANQDRTEWSPFATILRDMRLIDPTILHHGGSWWLFGTRMETGDNLKLFAWYADELTGPWQAHCANPLKTDIRSSRPAGPPFLHAGRLYRPSQDCSGGYGSALTINHVTSLTRDRFEEKFVSRIAPDRLGKYPTGLHTLCGAGNQTIIDGSRTAFMPGLVVRAFRRKFSRLLSGPPDRRS